VSGFSERLPVVVPGVLSDDDRAQLESIVDELGPWLQGPFPLGADLAAAGPWRCDVKWAAIGPLLGRLTGERTLDVGCNAGFDTFMLRLRGAGYVLGIEPYGFYEQAAFLESLYGTGADLRRIGWQALDPESHGRFDVVHCNSLLFREPHVVRLLLKLRAMVADGGRLLLGTLIDTGSADGRARFVAGDVAGDPTWWWIPDERALVELLDVTGFSVEASTTAGEEAIAPFPCAPRYVLARADHPPSEDLLAADLPSSEAVTRFPIGHYYSPAPDPRELEQEPRRSQIWPAEPRETVGIDWRDAQQLALLERFAAHEPLEFADAATPDPTEYFAANDQFPPLDAWLLAGLLEHLRPSRMIEIGSGFSTLVSARVNRERLDGSMALTLVEPYPRQFLLDGVPGVSDLRVEKVQDTPVEVFTELGDGDVLFIDSSHVVKTGSDVWWLFSEVLPRLRPGVHVHIHDIFLPGDYPEPWVMEGWGWNEIYLVQAFLTFNDAFEVVLGAYHLWHRHADALVAAFPGFASYVDTRGGGSLWLRRTR
jgi:SAM-dependent methyltransferase